MFIGKSIFLSLLLTLQNVPMLRAMTLSYHTSNPKSSQNRYPVFTTYWQTRQEQIILHKKEKENTRRVMGVGGGVAGKGGNPISLRQEVSILPICVFAGINYNASFSSGTSQLCCISKLFPLTFMSLGLYRTNLRHTVSFHCKSSGLHSSDSGLFRGSSQGVT